MITKRDEYGRVIYEPGDIIGVANYGFMGKIARNLFAPRTNLYHFLLIDTYLPDEDDYSIIESVMKGPTMGRLSWYRDRDYTVFRVNEYAQVFRDIFALHKYRLNASDTPENLGRWAVEKASLFGRHGYDFMLYVRLTTAVLQYQIGRLLSFKGFRRMEPSDIRYVRDKAFICTELVFEAWRAVGINLRAQGHAPIPAEIILANERRELIWLDRHKGKQGQTWREKLEKLATDTIAAQRAVRGFPGQTVGYTSKHEEPSTGVPPTEPRTIRVDRDKLEEAAAEGLSKAGPNIIARQGGQKRNRFHLYHQPFGYPIRACDWVAVDLKTLDNPRETGTEGDLAIRILRGDQYKPVCRHCLAVAEGKRSVVLEAEHGHGKGAKP